MYRRISITPQPEEVLEALKSPGGYLCRVAGKFGEDEQVPPEAIIGAWKVDNNGSIVGNFVPNEKYDPSLWPDPNRVQRSLTNSLSILRICIGVLVIALLGFFADYALR